MTILDYTTEEILLLSSIEFERMIQDLEQDIVNSFQDEWKELEQSQQNERDMMTFNHQWIKKGLDDQIQEWRKARAKAARDE